MEHGSHSLAGSLHRNDVDYRVGPICIHPCLGNYIPNSSSKGGYESKKREKTSWEDNKERNYGL